MLSPNQDFLRYASPNERRTISREDLGCYHAVIIGAVYEFGREFSIDSPSVLFGPVAHCIEQHPFLNVLVGDRHTDKAYYHRASGINLEDHIEVQKPAFALGDDTDHWSAVEGVLKSNLDRPFSHTIPPWRVIVLPFDKTQYFIAFAFSHVLGDGPSGVSFHRSFLEALRKPSSKGPSAPSIIQPSPQPLPVPFDTPERLPISWSFLLMPLIAVLVPQFVAKWLGFKAQVSDVDESTWTGLPVAFDPSHPEASQSKVVVRVVEADLIEKAIQESRKHNAKLTGLLHQFLARALSKTLANKEHTNLASQTAVNMRKSLGVPSDEMGEFVSATYLVHPITSSTGPLSDDEWEKASLATKKFADRTPSLRPQHKKMARG
ncbi:L-amino acid oxidase [Colletotrichum truncatum]|uniref:L-amino acid oxidase n=1 Tax=Colletotrichum truncatum TaxID=5467 RepID=A0ACC3ZG35_COLTU|nr:L-amino acid oxidase [Colletotrichum truncatum]KAF6801934.1 L-amino acid oxidase [Colletotrichum truncatum]